MMSVLYRATIVLMSIAFMGTTAIADEPWEPLAGTWAEQVRNGAVLQMAGGVGQVAVTANLSSGLNPCAYAIPDTGTMPFELIVLEGGNPECAGASLTLKPIDDDELTVVFEGIAIASFGAPILKRQKWPYRSEQAVRPNKDTAIIGLVLGMTRTEAEAILIDDRGLAKETLRNRGGLSVDKYGDIGQGEEVAIHYLRYSALGAEFEDRIAYIEREVRPEPGSLFSDQLKGALRNRYGDDAIPENSLQSFSNNKSSTRWIAFDGACQYPEGSQQRRSWDITLANLLAKRTLKLGCGPQMDFRVSAGGNNEVFAFNISIGQAAYLVNADWVQTALQLQEKVKRAEEAMKARGQASGNVDL